MKELTIIANKYSTDKGTEKCPDGGVHGSLPCHGFTEFYDEYFNNYKHNNPCILEIGVAEGGSTKMFYEYYESQCELYCIDISDSSKVVETIGPNVHFLKINQGNEKSLEEFTNFLDENNIKFDIIIDDGSHKSDDIMLTFKYLNNYVKPNGIYVIEDLHCCYSERFSKDINDDKYLPISFFIKHTDYYTYTKEENELLHKKIKQSILFSAENKYNRPYEEFKIGMTMIVYLNE